MLSNKDILELLLLNHKKDCGIVQVSELEAQESQQPIYKLLSVISTSESPLGNNTIQLQKKFVPQKIKTALEMAKEKRELKKAQEMARVLTPPPNSNRRSPSPAPAPASAQLEMPNFSFRLLTPSPSPNNHQRNRSSPPSPAPPPTLAQATAAALERKRIRLDKLRLIGSYQ
jgi:hypothetical protein